MAEHMDSESRGDLMGVVVRGGSGLVGFSRQEEKTGPLYNNVKI